MLDLNYWAVLGAGVAAFVAAFAYYAAFGKVLAEVGSAAADVDRQPAWLVPFELGKHLVLAAVVAARWSTRRCPAGSPPCTRATGSRSCWSSPSSSASGAEDGSAEPPGSHSPRWQRFRGTAT